MADRREYAARYDAMAQKLYQIAVYLTGDALEARRAIAACFVSGYDAAARGEAPFEETMLRELCRCCGDCPAVYGEQYRRQLADTLAPVRPDEKLCALLCDLEPWKRAVILLVFFGGAAADRLHCMVGRDPLETTRALRGFFRQLRQKKSLCRL